MDDITFSDQEIAEELSRLGYTNLPRDKLREFQKDLNLLVQAERSKNNSQENSFASGSKFPKDRNNSADVVQEQGAVGGAPSSYELRREDLDLDSSDRDVQFRKPAVPPQFALYELPHRAAPDLRDDVSEANSEVRRLKRKTLRKDVEGAKYIDESMSDLDAASLIDAHERKILCDELAKPSRRSQSARSRYSPPPYRLSPDDPRPPSVIYATTEHPHTKNLRRADPVNRFHQMQQVWAVQHAPGEDQHKTLRWNVREQMLTQFIPEKRPQRKYVPNNYVPPPMKRRDPLRWQIRLHMAQNTMPITPLNI